MAGSTSTETWIELGLVITGLWVFVVHCLTAENPFIDLRIFKDRNFTLGSMFMFIVGITLFSGLALLPPLLQNLMGYPVIFTSVIMAPRGVATMAFDDGGRPPQRQGRCAYPDAVRHRLHGLLALRDDRLQPADGLLASHHRPASSRALAWASCSCRCRRMAFATIAPKFRADGTAMFALVRNMGQGVGISLVTAVLSTMLQVNHAELAERLTATSQNVLNLVPTLVTGNGVIVSQINGLVSQQAAILSYLDDFWLMMLLSVSAIPLILLLRGAQKPSAAVKPKTDEEKAIERAHAMAE